ncbi:hypothetical protein BMF94_4880 [Rhodotorula taiwanensis]|uniref:Major facilitator superfamily (MFS) profile domain-containing protein n=1 Tax=Rhodotorula taiwanensis TaxID=741276 RepID=A0A2S5B5L3_9BASI|nr:hypothetical protein BMF94_4880 [Rhodotorula taiwanensis]
MKHIAGEPSKGMAAAVGMFVAFGGFLFGYDTGYISGVKAMPYFINLYGEPNAAGVREITTATDSLITSILSAGTFFGAILSGQVGTILGRRIGIAAYLVVFCAGVACQTAAKAVPLFAVGRVLAGLGVGGVSCLVPIYQSETAPKQFRGAIVGAYQLFITIGLLIAAVVVERTQSRNDPSCYQIPIGIQFIWAAILGAGLLVLPESPRWLVVRGHDERARRSIARLARLPIDAPYVTDELANIVASVHHERSLGKVSYPELLWRSNESRLPLRVWTGIGFQALQQLSGINGTTFFKNSGIQKPFLITIATNVVNVGMTLPGLWAVDALGRRYTTIYGSAGMAVCQLIVAVTGAAISVTNQAGQKVLVAFTCIYIAHFAAIWGPFAWVITSEIIPNAARSNGVSLTTGSQWLLNFAIGYATPYLVDKGPGKAGLGSNVFFIWGGCCVIGLVFAYFFVAETKGLSLEQIDLLYRNSSVRNSPKYRRQILEENLQDETKGAYLSTVHDKNTGAVGHLEHVDSEKEAV